MSQISEISDFDIDQLRQVVEMFNQHNGKSFIFTFNRLRYC